MIKKGMNEEAIKNELHSAAVCSLLGINQKNTMANKELQQRTEKTIKALGSYDDWKRGKRKVKNEWFKIKNPFPIGRSYAYNLARGKFDQVGKHGLRIMRDYFRELEKTNEDAG